MRIHSVDLVDGDSLLFFLARDQLDGFREALQYAEGQVQYL